MMERKTARIIALDLLAACRRDRSWSDGYLKAAIRKNGLDSRDAALTTRLGYGVLQNAGLLDFYIGCYCSQQPLAVFCTFFVAELGDKTQLTAITFGANEGMGSAFVVWIGCSLGLFAADILGMLVGYLLKSKTPDGLLNTLAFVIFSIFVVYTLYQGLKLISASVCPLPVWPVLIAATAVFVVVCVCLFVKREKKKAK